MSWYPKRNRYYAAFQLSDDIQQGDIFWGVPSLFAGHPAIEAAFADPSTTAPLAEDLDPLGRRNDIALKVYDEPVIVLPHTCDFWGPEKGRRNRIRLVGRVETLRASGIHEEDAAPLRSGEGFNHTFWLPDWKEPSRGELDRFLNLRLMTAVDALYLSRKRRVARLSSAAVITLRRRIAHFFTDLAPAPKEFVLADAAGGLTREDRDLKEFDSASS